MASNVARRFFTTTARQLSDQGKQQLKTESKRNPELLVLGGVMAAALGGAGLYFGSSPTKATSEAPVSIAKGGMPWEAESLGKYKYHPGGDKSQAPKDAPSALNVVVVPNVTLPREQHEAMNKWGKDGYP